jgi:hypothetical protein
VLQFDDFLFVLGGLGLEGLEVVEVGELFDLGFFEFLLELDFLGDGELEDVGFLFL